LKFGPIPVAKAEGAILAHATMAGDIRLKKSRRLTGQDIEALRQAGVATVVAAVLAPDDLDEDAAATAIAASFNSRGIEARQAATGRVNLHAREAGVFTVDKARIDAVNRVDPAITVATLAQYAPVLAGQMAATVKVIPFAVPQAVVGQVIALAQAGEAFAVHPFRPCSVSLIQTTLPGLKDSILDKTARATEHRLARSGSRLSEEIRIPHRTDELTSAIRRSAARGGMIVIFGASAVSDPDDIVPEAIRNAGGSILRIGMPVDPGNLLVLGQLNGRPVLGAPGCARSPKENGFDWVLDRLMAGLDVGGEDIAGMGVGGLLMEIPSRPQPREAPAARKTPGVHAVLLAAGRSSRMGGPNKLLASFEGAPLVRRVAERILASRAGGTVAVVGHQADRIGEALSSLDLKLVHNPDYASGLSTSLRAGVEALPAAADGALIALGDMPAVSTPDIDRLIGAFAAAGGTSIVRATHDGKRGNPVILPRALFAEVTKLGGDTGARQIVEAGGAAVIDVELGAAASLDVDTPEAMRLAGGVLAG
jgi:molybdenum cofactor cytidylyltransferase